MADDVLRQGVRGITDLITVPGLVNLDFADVRTIMTDAGSALSRDRHRLGREPRRRAARTAVSSPLLETSIEGATGILLNVSGPTDVGLFEVNEAAEVVTGAADQNANVIFGAVIDDALHEEVRVTVIATGFGERRRRRRRGGRSGRGAGARDRAAVRRGSRRARRAVVPARRVAPGRPATIWACRRSFSRRLSGTRSRTPPARGPRPHWRSDHFQVILATPGFTGLPLVEQHRAVNDALAEHFRDGTIHELRIRTKGTT